MLTDREKRAYAKTAVRRLARRETIVVSSDVLDGIDEFYPGVAGRVTTAWNKRQMGTKDTFVAWMFEDARPADLSYDNANMTAHASLGGK